MATARMAAARTRAVLVLKGADTIIAAPDGPVAINGSAPLPGDGGNGQCAGGDNPDLLAQVWKATCSGVYLHGQTGPLGGAGLFAKGLWH